LAKALGDARKIVVSNQKLEFTWRAAALDEALVMQVLRVSRRLRGDGDNSRRADRGDEGSRETRQSLRAISVFGLHARRRALGKADRGSGVDFEEGVLGGVSDERVEGVAEGVDRVRLPEADAFGLVLTRIGRLESWGSRPLRAHGPEASRVLDPVLSDDVHGGTPLDSRSRCGIR
jgi:hypothetical protein